MSKRIEGYFRALEKGTLPQYHDYHDVQHGRMAVEDYIKKWGPYRGARTGFKDV